jgi:ligand-binding sensor domain-containing protein
MRKYYFIYQHIFTSLILLPVFLFILFSCEDNGKIEKEPSDVSFTGIVVHELFMSDEGEICVGTGDGLFIFQDSLWYDYIPELGSVQVNDIAEYKGFFWIATNHGLLKVKRTGMNLEIVATHDPGNTCMNSEIVNELGISPKDELWVGTSEGVCYYTGDEWNNDLHIAILNKSISSFAFGQEEYYIGTYGNYLYHYYVQDIDGKSGASYLIPPFNGDLSTDTVYSCLLDSEGALWFGSTKGLTKNSIDTHVMSGSFDYFLENEKVFSLMVSEGYEIIAGTNKGLYMYNGTEWKGYTSMDGLPGDSVISLLNDLNGDTWIGTNKGLARLTGSGISVY